MLIACLGLSVESIHFDFGLITLLLISQQNNKPASFHFPMWRLVHFNSKLLKRDLALENRLERVFFFSLIWQSTKQGTLSE